MAELGVQQPVACASAPRPPDLPGVLRKAARARGRAGRRRQSSRSCWRWQAPRPPSSSIWSRWRPRRPASSPPAWSSRRGRPQVLPALGRPPAQPAAGRDLRARRGAHSRLAARRRHVQLLHRAQPPARRRRICSTSSSTRRPHRPCRRRPLGDGDAGEPAARLPLDAGVRRRAAATGSAPPTSRMAFNPYGARPRPTPTICRRTMVTERPAPRALFGAAWAAGYLARAAPAASTP